MMDKNLEFFFSIWRCVFPYESSLKVTWSRCIRIRYLYHRSMIINSFSLPIFRCLVLSRDIYIRYLHYRRSIIEKFFFPIWWCLVPRDVFEKNHVSIVFIEIAFSLHRDTFYKITWNLFYRNAVQINSTV